MLILVVIYENYRQREKCHDKSESFERYSWAVIIAGTIDDKYRVINVDDVKDQKATVEVKQVQRVLQSGT